ncbi:hypothetical protein EOA64_11365 [Mesorhizobium sp. M1A.F.Ca.IN.022.02.1.1]|uniref:hypothetical protein n=1 Tax=Mesorhizobium sp. M1A.F.Ca.IN.022.02.1.1 TaxID=2496766 RepID=UPI000FCCC0D6|nr:hypothetical protein [Mesorhizobium sp. M1A.F.Ca.IN.022.02.1.1]RUV62630.1 hypothetical protein EOA64_11365 [Mesorhizobium sp. M1A.F.Ca.IN.022.02.1.1]
MHLARIAFVYPVAFANVEPDLFGRSATDRGDIFTVRNGDVSQAALIARLPDTASEPLRKAAAAFDACFGALAEQANIDRSQVHPARFPDRVRELVTKHVSPAYQALTKAGVDERQSMDAAWKRVTTPPEPGTGTIRQEYRQLWQSLSLADRAARVENADIDELAGVIEGRGLFPDMTGTPVWDAIEQRSARLNVARMYNLNGAFAKQPTPTEPLASGPDSAQIEAEAQKMLGSFDRRRNELGLVETTLRSAIPAIAAATELPIEDAYKLLMGRA